MPAGPAHLSAPHEHRIDPLPPVPRRGPPPARRLCAKGCARLCQKAKPRSGTRRTRSRVHPVPLRQAAPAGRDHGRARGSGTAQRKGRRQVPGGSLLAHLLERLDGTSPRRLGPIPARSAVPAGSDTDPVGTARPLGGRLSGQQRDRALRCLGAGTGGYRLSAQPRPDVVRLDLDIYAGTALATGRGFLSAPPPGW